MWQTSMRLDLYSLRLFIAVAEERSIARAAARETELEKFAGRLLAAGLPVSRRYKAGRAPACTGVSAHSPPPVRAVHIEPE